MHTREEWLNDLMKLCKPQFESIGYPIPDNVRLSVGFPSTGRKSKRIGECWSAEASKDGKFEIFVTPVLGDTKRIAGVITHELVHAAVGLDKKHGPVFKKAATALGLEGKMTATTEGYVWHQWAGPILDRIGPIPHAELTNMSTAPKDQTNRHIKCECSGCGTIFRMSRKAIEAIEMFRCPNVECDGEVTCE